MTLEEFNVAHPALNAKDNLAERRGARLFITAKDRKTVAKAQAASNACDLIRDSLEADGQQKREAAVLARACEALSLTKRVRRG